MTRRVGTRWWAAALLGLLLHSAIPARALEIRVHPSDTVYSYLVEPQRGLYSAVLQNVAVWNSGASCTLTAVDVQALRAGVPTLTLTLDANDLDGAARLGSALRQQGALKLYDFLLQTSRYLPENVELSTGRTLEPGSALVIASKPLLIDAAVDEIAITAHATTASGAPVQARTVLKVKPYRSVNDYLFPVTGTWYVAAGPSLQSHHRWAINQEFALDLDSLGPNSRPYVGSGAKLTDYDGYGKQVIAAADGVVEDARDGAPEADANLQQPGETSQAYQQRLFTQQNALLSKGYLEVLGNYVVIRHEAGEFSSYAHLRPGSVRVKKGDTVKRGQAIACLGHSGNSTAPHLHFQVTNGPDPMYSRGIPAFFNNVTVEILGYRNAPLQSGWIVTTRP